MIPGRHLPHAEPNDDLKPLRRSRGETNLAWIERALDSSGIAAPALLLAGGCDLASFRARVAQSHLRADMTPSRWSHAVILVGARRKKILHVPLRTGDDLSRAPATNGIVEESARALDDPARYPNLALLSFPRVTTRVVKAAVSRLQGARLAEDLLSPILPWLGFVWGLRDNPLLNGAPLPSARFVEAVFGEAGVDLTPGLDARVACPEAFWQACRWWSSYYAAGVDGDAATTPRGVFVVDQPAAAITR
ncbi:MAG: hypothetical protein H6713_01770 [Myxococcales bacterium]|nr:hypothetical protein [Myxococcales bacterium]